MNELTVRAKLGKIVNYRTGLEKFREAVIKAEVHNKTVLGNGFCKEYKLPGSFVQFLVKIGAVEDIAPNTPRTEGKKLKWTYQGTDTGVIDSKLVDNIIVMELDQAREYRKNKQEQKQEEKIAVVNLKPIMKKGDGMDKVISWVNGELMKEDTVKSYLRPETKIMYQRIVEMLGSLTELKTIINKLDI